MLPRYPKPPRRIAHADYPARTRRSRPRSIKERASEHERNQLAVASAMETFRKDAVKLRKLAVTLDVEWLYEVSVELDNLANDLHARYARGVTSEVT